MATNKDSKTDSARFEKNRYLKDNGMPGLMQNLLCEGRCPDGAAPTVAFSAMSRERLQAIACQATNMLDTLPGNIAALGKMTAIAAYTEELEHNDMARIGWLTEFLAGIVDEAIFMKVEAEGHLAAPKDSEKMRAALS